MVILAAVDEKGKSERIIETGQELALAFGEDLVVLHVIPENEAEEHFESMREIEEFRETSFAVEIERAEEYAKKLTGKVLDEDDFIPAGRIGDPVEEILSFLDEKDIRYVVIGSRKRSPVGKAAFGSVAQSVILGAECPVVTRKI
jgi:nucleotide-binding universal stress UspA family protein